MCVLRMYVCVRAHVCECVPMHMCVSKHVYGCVPMHMCVSVCVLEPSMAVVSLLMIIGRRKITRVTQITNYFIMQ